jgi:DNA-binding HxlR family transcriptional regulator
MDPAPKIYGCPVELSLNLLGGKWKTVILARIEESPMRYSDLRRSIPELSEKVLTDRLRELRETGWVEQKDGYYRLTRRGESARPVLRSLCDWGKALAPEMNATFRSVS